jgi:hypothetical protein
MEKIKGFLGAKRAGKKKRWVITPFLFFRPFFGHSGASQEQVFERVLTKS